jgi:DNA processing protein
MDINILKKSDYSSGHLELLNEIPKPPEQIWYQGQLPPPGLKLLAVVGSRHYSSYGQQVLDYLIGGLVGQPIGIVSGLALGIDALAHEAALKYGLYTLAVPGSSLEEAVLYPARNKGLARKILENGGGLLTEFPPHTSAARYNFPQRNRIMAGLCHATLLIEAGEKSGTLITARLAADYNRELLAVPGDIFAKNSYGTHQFIKLGATPVTNPLDILEALHLEATEPTTSSLPLDLTDKEKLVIGLLASPKEKDLLIRELPCSIAEANILLMDMEIRGLISYQSPLYRSLV